MGFAAWTIFALCRVVFVTTPGPNAVNRVENGMHLGRGRALIGMLAILTRASACLGRFALGAERGPVALKAVFSRCVRRIPAFGFVIHGLLLGLFNAPGRV